MRADCVLIRPLILTEKGTSLREQNNKYLFEVHRKSSKTDIRRAVEELFDVNVVSVNTMLYRGKSRRMGRSQAKLQNWKKAVVSLRLGQTIDVFEGA